MYQTLIWAAVQGNEAGRLSAPFDSEDVECPSDALVDGVWGDFQLAGDFLGGQVLVDQAEAIELAGTQSSHALRNLHVYVRRNIRSRFRVGHPEHLQTQHPH